jgi:crossover junction endodeoxyribonuclease RuvC
VDPGLASVGWGVIESAGGRLVHLGHGCINTAAGDEMSARLLSIYDELSALIEEWKPNWASMESLFFWRNVTSAIPVSEAKGVIRLAFVKSGVPLVEYSPTAIKQAVVGTSRAEKEQVQEMVRILLGLSAIPRPNHAADALAAAICRSNQSGPLGGLLATVEKKAKPQRH